MAKRESAWVIKNKDNVIYLKTIRENRVKSIEAFIELAPKFDKKPKIWITYKRNGFSCVRITINLLQP